MRNAIVITCTHGPDDISLIVSAAEGDVAAVYTLTEEEARMAWEELAGTLEVFQMERQHREAGMVRA